MKAFPTTTYDHGAAMNGIGVSVTDDAGMDLRDYFAAQCLSMQFCFTGDKGHAEALAVKAYMYADAMIKARGE